MAKAKSDAKKATTVTKAAVRTCSSLSPPTNNLTLPLKPAKAVKAVVNNSDSDESSEESTSESVKPAAKKPAANAKGKTTPVSKISFSLFLRLC